jgi:Ca-activated chloride channel homolog
MKLQLTILLCCTYIGLLAQKENKAILNGNEAYKKGEFALAATNYTNALNTNNTNAVALYNKANALHKQSKFEEAASLYEAALKNSNDVSLQAKAAYNRGVANAKQQKWQDAVNDFKSALKLAPTNKEARENLQKAMNELKKQEPPKEEPKKDKKDEKKDDKKEKKPEQPKMNKDQMENELNKLRNQEKKLQQELQKQKVQKVSPEKDW